MARLLVVICPTGSSLDLAGACQTTLTLRKLSSKFERDRINIILRRRRAESKDLGPNPVTVFLSVHLV